MRHPWERAWIYVSPHPYIAITDANGAFKIDAIPPGRYVLRVWHEGWVLESDNEAKRPTYQPMGQRMALRVRAGRVTTVLLDQLARQ